MESQQTTNAFPLGDSTISQSSNTLYVYRETSGSELWSGTVMQVRFTILLGDKIRGAHLVVGNSSSQTDPMDTLYLGVYQEIVGGPGGGDILLHRYRELIFIIILTIIFNIFNLFFYHAFKRYIIIVYNK